jgi:ribosomal protein S18 acetylase RimI-like enzyme
MRLRPATLEDVPAVLAVRHDAFAAQAPQSYTPEEVATLLADVDEQELAAMVEARQLVVAEDEGAVVGCAGWLDGALRHVYVAPRATRHGLGSELVRLVELHYATAGGSELAAGVVVYARSFYERLGYETLSQERDWDGSAYFLMRKRLQT